MRFVKGFFIFLLFFWFKTSNASYQEDSCRSDKIAGVDVIYCYGPNRELYKVWPFFNQLKLVVNFLHRDINLYLTRIKMNIVNENTIIGSIQFDELHQGQFTRQLLFEAFPDLKNVKLYFDYDNSAALMGYTLNGINTLEGYVGQYLLEYDYSNEKSFIKEMQLTDTIEKPYDTKVTEIHNKNSTNFDLKSGGKSSIDLKLLIMINNENQLSGPEIRLWLKNILMIFSSANLIFSKFTSPKINLNIIGIIALVDKKPLPENIKEFNVDKVDFKKNFSPDRFDVIFSFYRETGTSISTRWIKELEKSNWLGKTIFRVPLDIEDGFGLQYLFIAKALSDYIRESRLVEDFPFCINIPKVIENMDSLLDYSNIWSNFTNGCDAEEVTEATTTLATTTEEVTEANTLIRTTVTHPESSTPVLKPSNFSFTNANDNHVQVPGSSTSTIVIILSIFGLVLLLVIFISTIITYKRRVIWWLHDEKKNGRKQNKLMRNCLPEEDLL